MDRQPLRDVSEALAPAPSPQPRRRQVGNVVAAAPTVMVVVTNDKAGSGDTAPTKTMRTRTTMKEQVWALATGTHPRCGARCPLWLLSPIMGGGGDGDGALVVRILWGWLWETSRFHCVMWGNYFGEVVMITFGVQLVLLALTHDMRWWVEGCAEELIGANQDFLVLRRMEVLFLLQDRVTGQRVPLLEYKKGRGCSCVATNGKWFVGCRGQRKLVVVEIPKKSNSGAKITIRKPTVVTFDKRWIICTLRFGIDEDHLLLHCTADFFELVLVDLLQTCALNKLVVLSSSVLRLETAPPRGSGGGFGILIGNPAYSFRKESGTHSFVTGHCILSAFSPGVSEFVTFEEGTGGKPQPTFKSCTPPHEGSLQQLDNSQFCVFSADVDAYEVWNLNDTTRPVRKQKFLSGCAKEAFVEGGLLFQVSESLKEIHVTEESSGVHIITFKTYERFCKENGGQVA
ncbi:hypothetical protein Pelo_18732 [Pelomyxa schiedti]|nr:hypothetical protein Pelo_18732 [Pelomyxa schiedti]